MPPPLSFDDGQDHWVSARISGVSGSDLFASPKLVSPNPNPLWGGHLDLVSCSSLAGWAENFNHPAAARPIIAFYDNGALLGFTASASTFRQDLYAAGIGDGAYGFNIPTPPSLQDGLTHNISAQVQGAGFTLYGTDVNGNPIPTITLSCPALIAPMSSSDSTIYNNSVPVPIT